MTPSPASELPCSTTSAADLINQRWGGTGGSSIDQLSRLADEVGAVDLARGSPEGQPPPEVQEAAVRAIHRGLNQYTNSWGLQSLREGIAARSLEDRGVELDPETEVTVTCGVTEATPAVFLALAEPGDEIVLFEPFFENHLTAAKAAGFTPRFVRTHAPDWHFDSGELEQAFGPRTKAVLINSPGNPSGKVFDHEELLQIAELCCRWNAVCVTDEVYEHFVYDGRRHESMIQIPSMRDRTLVMTSFSKTYCVSGWRIASVCGSPVLTSAVRQVHELLTCCAASPLQAAAAAALQLPREYYRQLKEQTQHLRDRLQAALEALGFSCSSAQGGYFLMADISASGLRTDHEFVEHLIRHVGIAAVPGSIFYSSDEAGAQQVRFCFAKSERTIEAARSRLLAMKSGAA